jgi:hypothetical protein
MHQARQKTSLSGRRTRRNRDLPTNDRKSALLFKRNLVLARRNSFYVPRKIIIANGAAGDIASRHAHNPAYHSGSAFDRSVANLALQQRLGLLPGRRPADFDYFDFGTVARLESR